MQPATTRRSTDEQPADPTGRRLEPDSAVEAVRLRNYDHWQGHSLRVEVTPAGGDVAIAERRYLAPGQSAHLTGPLEGGTYEVRVWVDGVEQARDSYRIDDTTAGTAAVELGNGVVSLTGGASGESSTT